VVARVRETKKKYPHAVVAVDGGVSLANARQLMDAGANRLVVGSAIFGALRPRAVIEQFRQLG
jgi:ribulose-phosphate 3-epimerase